MREMRGREWGVGEMRCFVAGAQPCGLPMRCNDTGVCMPSLKITARKVRFRKIFFEGRKISDLVSKAYLLIRNSSESKYTPLILCTTSKAFLYAISASST